MFSSCVVTVYVCHTGIETPININIIAASGHNYTESHGSIIIHNDVQIDILATQHTKQLCIWKKVNMLVETPSAKHII